MNVRRVSQVRVLQRTNVGTRGSFLRALSHVSRYVFLSYVYGVGLFVR